MRCTQCGLPLSPSRSYCPRCGTSKEKASGKIRQIRAASQQPDHTVSPQEQPWGAPPPFAAPPAAEQQWRVPSTPISAMPPSAPLPQQAPLVMQPNQLRENRTFTPLAAFRIPGSPSQPPRVRLGFTIAGTCMATGALLLILVYFMAQNLTIAPTSADTNTSATPVQNPPLSTPTSVVHKAELTHKTIVAPTSTPTNQQYIDNVHLATSVDTTTGKPVSLSNIFYVQQPIYVTLTLHPSAYNGAICLKWTVNNQSIPYNTAIGNSTLLQMNAYFFFKPGTAGQGTVDVAWAATTSCTNAVAIHHLDFTVEP